MKVKLLKKVRRRYQILLVERIGGKFLTTPYFKLIDTEDGDMHISRDLDYLNEKLINWVKQAYPKAMKRKRNK